MDETQNGRWAWCHCLSVSTLHLKYPPQLSRVLKLVLRLIKDQSEQALLVAELLQDMAVMIKKLVTVFLDQSRPAVLSGTALASLDGGFGRSSPS
jgi:hypothetical protein